MNKELAMRVADRLAFGEKNGMHTWQWDQGVALCGLCAVYKTTGCEKYIEYIERWIDDMLSKAAPGKSINTTAPLFSALVVCKKTGDEKYLGICKEFAEWCLCEAPRSDRGAFEHSCTENVYPNQIWADTLFMGCLFLVGYGMMTGQDMYIKEALRQFVLHYDFLHDEQTGLIYHGYYGNERVRKGVLWGRGNGWYSAAAAMILSAVPDRFELKAVIKEQFLKHTDGLIKLQNESGGWNTVVDNNDTYEEMTATAAFSYGIGLAVKNGIIDSKYSCAAQNGHDRLAANIDFCGTVKNASGGTCVMENWQNYNDIQCMYSNFAQGLAMLALTGENVLDMLAE